MPPSVDVTKVKLTPMSLVWLFVALVVVVALGFAAYGTVNWARNRSALVRKATGGGGAGGPVGGNTNQRQNLPPAAAAAYAGAN